MMGLTTSVFLILVLVSQFGLSIQACNECSCCKGSHNCNTNKNCVIGCIDGYYGDKCTEECLENCKTCVNGNECAECKHGYYDNKCNLQCGKGCVNNTCSMLSGECSCKSANFTKGKCDTCLGLSYGDECNYTCPSNCGSCTSDTECTKCKPGYYTNKCNLKCGKGCVNNTCLHESGECSCKSANFNIGKCDTCLGLSYGDECNYTCPGNCGSCTSDTECQWCLNTAYYGSYCQHRCSVGCDLGRCNKATGYCIAGCKSNYNGDICDTCSTGIYGKYCDLNCPENCSACVSATNCTECVDGYEGLECVLAIKGADLEEKKPLVVFAGSAGAGVVVIVLLLILVICLIKRNRRQNLSSNTKCEENDYVLDMKNIPNQTDEPGVIYAKPFKPKQEAGGDAGKEYDTAYDGDQKIPAIDNGYTAVNIETSANEKNKSFEVCDIEHSNKPPSGNDDYAVVNKGKSTVKENEYIEEVYDTTHGNTKNKQPLNSNNDYAVLSVRSNSTKGFGKSNLAQPDDVYDSAEGGKHKTMSHQSNDYAVFNSNNGDKHGNDKANTLYDTATDKKMRPGNNDYDFCELDTD